MRYSVKKFLKARNIDPQTIDVEALWDSSLTQKENFRILREEASKRGKLYKNNSEEYAERYRDERINNIYRDHVVSEVESKRSLRAIATDRALKAPVTSDIEKWRRNPNKYDLKGNNRV